MTRFHEATLRELGLVYEPDDDAMAELSRRGAVLGVRVPASFFEWFGMRDGIELLREHSNGDHPTEIADLALAAGLEPRLQFMVENQCVCRWSIPLDGGDDPPVLVAVDPDFVWRPHAASFSTFIACQVWDHAKRWERPLLQAQARILAEEDLAFLRRTFRERPTTHAWPGKHAFRFERDDAHVLIWDSEHQADWWISASSDENLTVLTRELWTCSDLSQSLWSVDERGKQILRALRAG